MYDYSLAAFTLLNFRPRISRERFLASEFDYIQTEILLCTQYLMTGIVHLYKQNIGSLSLL